MTDTKRNTQTGLSDKFVWSPESIQWDAKKKKVSKKTKTSQKVTS